MSAGESIYADLRAEGLAADAPRHVRVERRADRAIVTMDDPERLMS